MKTELLIQSTLGKHDVATWLYVFNGLLGSHSVTVIISLACNAQ